MVRLLYGQFIFACAFFPSPIYLSLLPVSCFTTLNLLTGSIDTFLTFQAVPWLWVFDVLYFLFPELFYTHLTLSHPHDTCLSLLECLSFHLQLKALYNNKCSKQNQERIGLASIMMTFLIVFFRIGPNSYL